MARAYSGDDAKRAFPSLAKVCQFDVLGINGREMDGNQDGLSSTTYFVCLLSRTLRNMRIALPLTHLCSQHATPGDPLEGTKGMMRALIWQVLVAYGDSLDLSFINHAFLQRVVQQDVMMLCELFRGLLTSCEQATIFCLLDGISWFETATRIQDLTAAMSFLQHMTEEIDNRGGYLTFKLLLISPIVSEHALEWFPSDSIHSMQKEAERHNYGLDEWQMREATE
jgi:hypothetical protein